MTNQLPDTIHEKIKLLCQEGDDLMTQGNYEAASKKFMSALHCIPEDRK
ncbi:hypothetical protein [Undibacterium sp. Di24W]